MTTPTFRFEGVVEPALTAQLAAFLDKHAGEPVRLIVNSGGGECFAGAAALAAIEAHGRVRAEVHGIAASAGSLILCGATSVWMHPAALLMIHDPVVGALGSPEYLHQVAEMGDKLRSTYAQAYARSSGQPVARILAWMAAETWLTPEEAVELGFADGILAAPPPAPQPAAFAYAQYRAAPPELAALARTQGWGIPKFNESSNATKEGAENA